MAAFDLHSYDCYIVAFSGGKDSVACFLYLLECGVDRSKIELMHHNIDGAENGQEAFMDWEVTPDYCRQFAAAFGVPIYFSWKEGGFKRELLRENTLTAPTTFEDQSRALITVGGKHGKKSTRRKFPQVVADLKTRWCSSYLKIDVCSAALANQKRFVGQRTLVLSGERGEESPQRAKYAIHEPDRTDLRTGRKPRYVDRLRPIRDWDEQQVWAIMERHRVQPHPAYELGFGRVSCKFCIFGNADQFASACHISPRQGQTIIDLEAEFGVTIKRKVSIPQLVQKGSPYPAIRANPGVVAQATSTVYDKPILVQHWQLPAGAYKEICGPS